MSSSARFFRPFDIHLHVLTLINNYSNNTFTFPYDQVNFVAKCNRTCNVIDARHVSVL